MCFASKPQGYADGRDVLLAFTALTLSLFTASLGSVCPKVGDTEGAPQLPNKTFIG